MNDSIYLLMLTMIGVLGVITVVGAVYQVVQTRQSERIAADQQRLVLFSEMSRERAEMEAQVAELQARFMKSESRFEEVSHLLLEAQQKYTKLSQEITPPAVDADTFLRSLGLKADELRVDPKKVFLLTPFEELELPLYQALRETFSSTSLRITRGDERKSTGNILSHIVREMLTARLVLANISSRNPNVMYELGIAHSFGKQVVLLSNTESELPFDIQGNRTIFFENIADLQELIQQFIITWIID